MLEYPGDWKADLGLWIADFELPDARISLLVDGEVSSLSLEQVDPDQFFFAWTQYQATPVYDTESGAWLRDGDRSLTVELATKEYEVASKMVYCWEPDK